MEFKNFRPDWNNPTPDMFSSHAAYLKYMESIEREYIEEESLGLEKLKENIKKENCSEETKESALELIEDIYNYALDYVSIIRKQGSIKSNNKEEEYKEKMETIDEARTRKHNTLIDSINIANRYLINNFEKFKSNPIKVSTDNRDVVKDWAIRLMEELSKIKKSSI